eukprot:GFUD01040175.1.p1 GENE.GFUD01040175.1~~GFUD01040175.1.p1  ORF type:complete len:236 (+),score=82.34 GFUD01040175.1:36-743(+)
MSEGRTDSGGKKMESLEEKLGRLTNCLHDIKGLGIKISAEQRGILRRLVSQASAELEDVKEFLVGSVSDQLSPRQVAVLGGEEDLIEEEEERDDVEMEWDSVFGRCFNVGINIRIYRQKLEVDMVDTLTLAIILSDLRKVQSELELHSTAILSGKMSSLEVPGGQLAGSTTCLATTRGETAVGRSVKYKKNKTENLATKISNTVFGSEKRSGGPARKTSIIKNLSTSMLKLKIHN